MAGLQVFSGDLHPKKGRHISRADLFLSFFNFHGSLISVSLPLLIPASVLPDKPAVRCHAVREHDSLCSIGNLIERTRRRRTSGGRSPTTTAAERRHSNHSSPAGLEHTKRAIHRMTLFSISLKARDGIRTRDPRLGKAILHH